MLFRSALDIFRKAEAAIAANTDEIGVDDLVEKISGGYLDFDAVVATPDMMGKVGRLGRILGPRGLMPNPKTGTVTMDVAKAVSDIKGGKIEFRVDRHANLQFIIGKASFTEQQLVENYFAALEEILRLKPAASKGRYVKKVAFSATMSPSAQHGGFRVVLLLHVRVRVGDRHHARPRQSHRRRPQPHAIEDRKSVV